MKKIIMFCIILLICGIIVISYLGYDLAHQPNNQSTQCPADVFEMNLFSDKEVYKTTDAIQIWATLEYTGDNDTIEILHGIPYMSFVISDGKNFTTGGICQTILTSSILEKGEIYHFDYQKSGAWNQDDPDAGFWENFYSEKDLFLPAGEYTVTLKGDFYLTYSEQKGLEDYSDLLCELNIKVEK
ncbi:hypothetical protein [Candidatus Bathycorpusculum sp.]|uniref:hypothetical protein n=1 Tax=Candidatus Bathycorpusculum sp. TaxID=2994959 RepID=UPI00281919E7|nr:hypothetical protein [Candidatus Termitimicrobium sp.]MCL2685661.1 hypothetical protein [Candidatus Termitimicrobium sp.]